jgi:uncharacterized protein (TIRG00374 family)
MATRSVPNPPEIFAAPDAPGRSRWARRCLNLLVAFLTAFAVWANREELPRALAALRHARIFWLAVTLILTIAALLNLGVMHAAAQRGTGLEPAMRSIVPAGLAAHFLNIVTKSGGLAGMAALTTEAKATGKPRGAAMAAYLLTTALGEVAFAAVLGTALVALGGQGRFGSTEKIAAVLFALYLVATLGVLLAALRSRTTVRRLLALPAAIIWWLKAHALGDKKAFQPDHEHADELFETAAILRRSPARAVPAGLSCLLVDLLGIAQLWAVLAGLGVHAGVGEPLVAYSMSTLFGIVGGVPGGLGLVEVSLAGVLHSFGTTLGVAAAAVVLYRTAEFWVPLAVGAIFARNLVKQSRPATS